MQEFPFSNEDWDQVCELTRQVCNATLQDDWVLRASYFEELKHYLAEMQSRYGEHPILWETEADFLLDADEQIYLYQQAKNLALRHGLPTYTIRIALARVLIEDCSELAAGHRELVDCQREVEERGDEHEQRSWKQLLAKCERH